MVVSAAFSRSTHLPPTASSKLVKPVRLPPGRASDATMPSSTGSATSRNTTGVAPECPPAWPRAPGLPWAIRRPGFRCSNETAAADSAAGAGSAQPQVEFQIVALAPAELTQPVQQRLPQGLDLLRAERGDHADRVFALADLALGGEPGHRRPGRDRADQGSPSHASIGGFCIHGARAAAFVLPRAAKSGSRGAVNASAWVRD